MTRPKPDAAIPPSSEVAAVTEEAINFAANFESVFDGRGELKSLSRVDRDRYLSRAREMLFALATLGKLTPKLSPDLDYWPMTAAGPNTQEPPLGRADDEQHNCTEALQLLGRLT